MSSVISKHKLRKFISEELREISPEYRQFTDDIINGAFKEFDLMYFIEGICVKLIDKEGR